MPKNDANAGGGRVAVSSYKLVLRTLEFAKADATRKITLYSTLRSTV